MKKQTKRFLIAVISIFALFGVGGSHTAFAGNSVPQMRIYDIYLGNGVKGGDSVLVESGGEYLLMDLGTYEQTVQYVIPLIKELNIKKLNIYFSHMHIDHYGGKENKLTAGLDAIHNIPGLKINNLYLPDDSIGKQVSSYTDKYGKFIDAYQKYGNTTGKVVRLKKGSSFAFGKVRANVIGPLGTEKTVSQLGGQRERYENNMSLITMLTCGRTKYLTCGDAMDSQEELLVAAYKYTGELDADIFKMSHHGTSGANSESFAAEVSPAYSFAQNSGYLGYLTSGNKWKETYSAVNAVRKYGLYYLTADEGKTLVLDTGADAKVSLYKRYSPVNLRQLKGWVTVKGSTGLKNDTTDKFYLGSDGRPYKGIKKISGTSYWFNANLIKGKYSVSSHKWNPLYKVGKSHRYFNTSTGEMYVGFNVIGGKKYYFNNNGIRQVGSSSWKIKKINGSYYALNQNGVIALNAWKKYSGGWRYFGSSGKMMTGFKKIGKDKYYLDTKTGYRLQNSFKTISRKKYYFGNTGKMYKSVLKKIGKYRYYFDKNGCAAVSKTVTVSGKTYYFDKNGRSTQNKIAKIGKYSYYFSSSGVMAKSKFIKSGKYTYYFDQKGHMVKNKTLKIQGKKYKFDKKGHIK